MAVVAFNTIHYRVDFVGVLVGIGVVSRRVDRGEGWVIEFVAI